MCALNTVKISKTKTIRLTDEKKSWTNLILSAAEASVT